MHRNERSRHFGIRVNSLPALTGSALAATLVWEGGMYPAIGPWVVRAETDDPPTQPVTGVLAERANLPHGVTGDQWLVFVADPLNARVAVIDRSTGVEIAEIRLPGH